MEAILGSIDLPYAILLLQALDQGPDHDIHAWHDTTTGCDHNLGLSWDTVNLCRGGRSQEFKTCLELTEMRVKLLLQAESPRVSK